MTRRLVGERWWWLPAFCLASLLLHLTIGFGTRGLSFGLPHAIAPKPAPDVEVVLSGGTASASAPSPVRSTRPLAAAAVKARPAASKVTSTPVIRSAPRASERLEHPRPATVPVPRPVERAATVATETVTPPTNVPVTTETPVTAVRPALPLPPTTYKPTVNAPPLGIRSGDRNLTAEARALPEQPRALASAAPKRTLAQIGKGGGGGQVTPGIPAPGAPASGSGKDAPGIGAGQGTLIGPGSGTEGTGNGGGLRGLPFGDPNGVRGGTGSGGGGANSGGPAPVSGESGNGGGGQGGAIRAVYVLDVSGSMRRDDRIGHAKEALRDALRELRPTDAFAIVLFSDDARPLRSRMVSATPEALREAFLQISLIDLAQSQFGHTNYSTAINAATRFRGATHIFFITDGSPNAGVGIHPEEPDETFIHEDEITDYFRQTNRENASIFTFFIGDTRDSGGMRLLRRIAVQNNGAFRYVDVRSLR